MLPTVTANSSVSGATKVVDVWAAVAEQNEPVPQRGLFEVEVFGFDRIDLVPKNALAAALAHCLLHGTISPSMTYRGMAMAEKGQAERVTLSIAYQPALSKKVAKDPFRCQQRLTPEQVAKIEQALNPPAEQVKAKRTRTRGKK